MKKSIAMFIGMGWLAAISGLAGEPIQGRILELHSCELYAGGCKVSSESPQGGHYMLRVWNFTGGSFAGEKLQGLTLAVLQISDNNLAERGTPANSTMVYLPNTVTARQQSILLAWLKSSQPELAGLRCTVRMVPMSYHQDMLQANFVAGDTMSVQTVPREACTAASCGEQLWYLPRTPTTAFTVVLNRASQVNEPRLNFKWSDSGRPTVFLGWLGQPPKDLGCASLVPGNVDNNSRFLVLN